MGAKVKVLGSWKKTETYLKRAKNFDPIPILQRYGEIGVKQLYEATPKRTGLTAASWWYDIEKTKDGYILSWNNSNIQRGINIALIIQQGHITSTGFYVAGRDYINPAMEKVFKEIETQIWKEVK